MPTADPKWLPTGSQKAPQTLMKLSTYFLLTCGLLGLAKSHSPHFGRFLTACIPELDLEWILYPFWGPKWVRNATKLNLNLPVSCSSVVSDFLECQVDVHAPFWSGLVSFDHQLSLKSIVLFNASLFGKASLRQQSRIMFSPHK